MPWAVCTIYNMSETIQVKTFENQDDPYMKYTELQGCCHKKDIGNIVRKEWQKKELSSSDLLLSFY